MIRDLLRPVKCAVPAASDAYERLFRIVRQNYAHYDEPKQAIILALAYAEYSVTKKDNIKDIYGSLGANPRETDIERRDSEIRGAWRHISNEKQLTQYCEGSDRLLTALLKDTQSQARQVIDQAIIDEIEKLVDTTATIQQETGRLANIQTILQTAQTSSKDSKKTQNVLLDEARPIRLFVTKPLQTFVASLVILSVSVVALLLVRALSQDAIAWVVAKLGALAKFLAAP